MEKVFNVLCRKDGEYTVVKVKSTSFYDAKKVVEDMHPVQCVSSKFAKLFKRYQKAYKKIEQAGYEAVQEVMEVVPIDGCKTIAGQYVIVDSLSDHCFYICDDSGTLALWCLADDPLTELVEWVEEIAHVL